MTKKKKSAPDGGNECARKNGVLEELRQFILTGESFVFGAGSGSGRVAVDTVEDMSVQSSSLGRLDVPC